MKLLRGARSALLVLAVLAIFARLFLIWNIDRSGGITCIWLRNRPALKWREFSTATAAASHAASLICGDENGVFGEDSMRWNARLGCWLLPAAALTAALLELGLVRSARRNGRAG